MHHPGLPDLFEALIVVRAAAQAIEILRNDGMVRLGQAKPIHLDVSVIANVRADREADLGPVTACLDQARQISEDDIRSRRHCFRKALSPAASEKHGEEQKHQRRTQHSLQHFPTHPFEPVQKVMKSFTHDVDSHVSRAGTGLTRLAREGEAKDVVPLR